VGSDRIALLDFPIEVPPFARFSFGVGGTAAKGAQLRRYTEYRDELARCLLASGAFRQFHEPLVCPLFAKVWITVKHDRPDSDNTLKNAMDGLTDTYGMVKVGKEKVRMLKWRGIVRNDKQIRGHLNGLDVGRSRLVVALYLWDEGRSLAARDRELASRSSGWRGAA
jgi:Holliday junction resolvase RusA-like endonuclease